MLYVLGIITGLLIAVIIFLSTKRYQIPIERTLKQLENKTKEKGEVYIDSEEKIELESYLDSIPKE